MLIDARHEPSVAERVRAVGSFTIATCHQEVKGTQDDIGRFDVDRTVAPPVVGRAMVVLKWISG